MKKALFISHDASLSGAPRVLYLFLKWLGKNQPGIQRHLLMLHGGGMEKLFSLESEMSAVLEHNPSNDNRGLLKKIRQRLSNRPSTGIPEWMTNEVKDNNYSLVYANTVASLAHGAHICDLADNRTKLFLHVHELDTMITIVQPRFDELAGRVHKFIAASELVKEQLVSRRGIDESKISVVYEFSEIPVGIPLRNSEQQEFVVCAAGTVEYRKGFDTFIEVARTIKKREPGAQIRFTWVGKIADDLRAFVEADLSHSGLSDMVTFAGEKENAATHISECDVFLLPSREDPFPLVCIEAGMLGKPVICYEKATGINEVIRHGGGHSIAFGDVEATANIILQYYHNRILMQNDGKRAKELFASFTPEIQCDKLFKLLG